MERRRHDTTQPLAVFHVITSHFARYNRTSDYNNIPVPATSGKPVGIPSMDTSHTKAFSSYRKSPAPGKKIRVAAAIPPFWCGITIPPSLKLNSLGHSLIMGYPEVGVWFGGQGIVNSISNAIQDILRCHLFFGFSIPILFQTISKWSGRLWSLS